MTFDPEFQRLYETEFVKAFRAALVVCGNRSVAEEAAQEAFARALERWNRLRDQPWAAGWVIRTAMNHARRSMRRRPLARADVTSSADLDARLDLWEGIRSLPPRQQTAVVLYYAVGLPLGEVAEAMGCAAGTVKAHLAKARVSLRARLEEVRDE